MTANRMHGCIEKYMYTTKMSASDEVCIVSIYRLQYWNFWFVVDVVVTFLSQEIFDFLLFFNMGIYANEVETKEI